MNAAAHRGNAPRPGECHFGQPTPRRAAGGCPRRAATLPVLGVGVGSWIVIACCTALLLGLPTPGRAADAGEIRRHLRVEPGATCLQTDLLAQQVEQWLYDTAVAGDLAIVVEGSRTDPHSARVRVTRGGRTVAHRSFEPGPARCGHLHAALGLVIGLALKASLLEALGQPQADDPVSKHAGWAVAATGLLTHDVLPALGPGLDLAVGHTWQQHLSLRLGALATRAHAVALPDGAGQFDATLGGLRAEACFEGALWDGVAARLCTGLLGGALWASGRGLPGARTTAVGYAAVTQGASLRVSLAPHWSASLSALVLTPLHRIAVGLEGADGSLLASRTLARAGFAAGLGPVYHF